MGGKQAAVESEGWGGTGGSIRVGEGLTSFTATPDSLSIEGKLGHVLVLGFGHRREVYGR